MKIIFFFSLICMLPAGSYSAQGDTKVKSKQSGIIEHRQYAAREIMKDNFNTAGRTEVKKKSNFGFHKLKDKKIKKL